MLWHNDLHRRPIDIPFLICSTLHIANTACHGMSSIQGAWSAPVSSCLTKAGKGWKVLQTLSKPKLNSKHSWQIAKQRSGRTDLTAMNNLTSASGSWAPLATPEDQATSGSGEPCLRHGRNKVGTHLKPLNAMTVFSPEADQKKHPCFPFIRPGENAKPPPFLGSQV